MAEVVKKPVQGKPVQPVGAKPAATGKEAPKQSGNAMTAAALEGMDSAPLPESTPNPGQPGFHWGM